MLGTPYVLAALHGLHGDAWRDAGEVAGVYGGVATILGMLALAGVAGSLLLQAREGAANREVAQRSFHTELILRAIDDPALRACWGPLPQEDEEARQHLYTNLIVTFWRSMFEIGKITDDQLRLLAAQLFAGTPGRRYWALAGPAMSAQYTRKRDREFLLILQLACDRASVSASPPAGTAPGP
ncbi:DUF6082 family protein [Streptomyces sp. NPDC050418]|uniref:DUF6082 family protein n=1 Tax=Streptomyces sp. NPDC050418 TaxID=3365612 RepID=UPI0037BBC53E